MAEGYTEAVVVLLAKRWSSVHELAAVAKRDPSFGKFVLRHINASADPELRLQKAALSEYQKIAAGLLAVPSRSGP